MKATLIGCIDSPYEVSVASARTCYSSSPVRPEQVSLTQKKRVLRDRIARATLEAGHLTTRQHTHFTFLLEGVSRGLIWSFLHSHPFYNSEQVSQRYVEVQPDAFITPEGLGDEAEVAWKRVMDAQMAGYHEVAASLFPSVKQAYFERFPARKKNAPKYSLAIHRQCLEDARYLLPLATKANLYHTISSLTLLRYLRMANQHEFPDEATKLCKLMLDAILEIDPLFAKDVGDVDATASESWAYAEASQVPWPGEKVDAFLGRNDVVLTEFSSSVGDEMLDTVMNPAKNAFLLDSLGLYSMDRGSQIMQLVNLMFMKRNSLAADAQTQRHRAIHRFQPRLPQQFPTSSQVRSPAKVLACSTTAQVYDQAVNEICDKGRELESLVGPLAHYALPGGTDITYIESGTLLGFYHRWKMRLCDLAQDEIRAMSKAEVREVAGVMDVKWVGAPCHINMWGGVRPICPEKERFCGKSVWKESVA